MVYGPTRTRKLRDWEILHHIGKHGTRYAVNAKLKAELDRTVARGKQIIDVFLKNKTGEPGAQQVLGTKRLREVWGPMAPFHQPT